MKIEKERNHTHDEEIADLSVAPEQAEQTRGGAQGDRPMESLSINFTKIEYKYTPYDDRH